MANDNVVPHKEFTIRKLADPGQQDMMIARLHKMWSDDSNSVRHVDLGAYQGLDLFWEQAPVVEEDDEKQKELIKQNEELTKLDGKRRDTAGVREPRWVLRDNVRRKAERRVRREAEQRGDPPPHDPRLLKIKDGGLLMLGTREGILKTANAEQKQHKKSGAEDTSRARYAVMVQTGDNEVSIANLGGWLTFRGETLSGAGSAKVSKRASSVKRDQLRQLLKEDELNRSQVPTTVVSGVGTGGRRKTRKEDKFDGYDEQDVGTGAAYFATEVLDTLQGGEGEEEADNENMVRSDDEAGSDGRDDTRTFDVNNQDASSEDEEDEDEDEEEEELDEESKIKREKLLAKLRANKKNEQPVEDDSEGSEEEQVVASKTVQYLVAQKKITAAPSQETRKKRDRSEDASMSGQPTQRPKVSPIGGTEAFVLSKQGISETEVRTLLEQGNGRIKTKDMRNHFKKRISASTTAKNDLISILNHLVVKQNDEVEGMMYVLKGRQFS